MDFPVLSIPYVIHGLSLVQVMFHHFQRHNSSTSLFSVCGRETCSSTSIVKYYLSFSLPWCFIIGPFHVWSDDIFNRFRLIHIRPVPFYILYIATVPSNNSRPVARTEQLKFKLLHRKLFRIYRKFSRMGR